MAKKKKKQQSFRRSQRESRDSKLIDGIPADEFELQNADPIYLHQHKMHEHMPSFDEPKNIIREAEDDDLFD